MEVLAEINVAKSQTPFICHDTVLCLCCHLKMKIMRLPQNVFNIQKCLLPDCDFIKVNYGSYCMIVNSESSCGVLVKIGLSRSKQTAGGFFVDKSVIIFQNSYRAKCFIEQTDVVYQHFKLLPSPLGAIAVNVRIVFNDDTTSVSHKKRLHGLQWRIKEILKLYVFARNSIIFLESLSESQRDGMYCLDILDVNYQGQIQDIDIYKSTDGTKVNIIDCVGKRKYEMCYCYKEEIKLGGLGQFYEMLKERIEFSKKFLYPSSKVSKVTKLVNKVLLAGPPGCGKTSLIYNVVRDCKTALIELLISKLCSSLPGETEQRLQNVFNEAKLHADNQESCVILIEDIDVLCGKRGDASSNLKRSLNKLVSLLKDFENRYGIIIIATATNLEDIDPQLRKAKCFDDELVIMPPTEEDREEIITNIFEYFKVKCSKNVIKNFVLWTPGFVGADLQLAVQECIVLYHKIMSGSVDIDNHLLESCFKKVLSDITPTSLKTSVGQLVTKNIDFSKIGGLHTIKKLLDFSVNQQLVNPEMFVKMGIPLTKGILLYGPPGCAKTTLVKALAKESNMTFLSVSSADLYSPYVGDPEKKVLQLFSQARIGAPAIIFIDEIDGLVGSKAGDRMRGVQERVLSTLLVEMDGVGVTTVRRKISSLESRSFLNTGKYESNEIVVIGATNRPERLDDALKRPGRFDKIVYVPPPDEKERLNILQKLTEKMLLDGSVDLKLLARETDYYSGADLKNLCHEAAIFSLTENGMTVTHVSSTHFKYVLRRSRPSLNSEIIRFYESFQKNLH